MKDNNKVQAANAFVKAEQAKMKAKMGSRPGVSSDMKHFNANMTNDGDNAKKFGKKLCGGMDDAFPVR